MGILTVAAVLGFIGYALKYIMSRARFIFRRISSLQGPAALPFIGNLHQLRFNPDEFFEQAQGLGYMLREQGSRVCRIWLSGIPFVLLYGAEECESVLGSSRMLNKPFHYQFLSSWIGQGLLIREPKTWRPRRKLLTPTFHYDILKDFVEIYNRHGRTLSLRLWAKAGNQFEDVFHTVTLCTLDVICEAALGVCIDAQNKPNSPYLDAVFGMKKIIFNRMLNPLMYPDIMFKVFGRGREHDAHVQALHEFTGRVISERKLLADAAGGVELLLKKETAEGRRRMAFLDLMLDMHARGDLEWEGIQEEVDTFTFEGHDTTSAAMNWFLHLMGANPEKQAAVHKELDEVFGGSDRTVTYEDLANLRYLEAALKETLRLYPSVPIIGRQCVDDLKLRDDTLLPAGTVVVIIPSMVHKDERYWDDPEVFRPERFLENSENRHPYAYIPFSAGSRNCIGQRFAMMEEKCIIAILLRQFKVTAKLPTHEMRVSAELIIRPLYGNQLMLEKRSPADYSSSFSSAHSVIKTRA